MHRGIVHDSGRGQGMADQQRIAKMYIFPHAWEILLNKLWGVRPVHSITFENPVVPPPRESLVKLEKTETRRTQNERKIEENEKVVDEGALIRTTTRGVELERSTIIYKYQYAKGEVYKVRHHAEVNGVKKSLDDIIKEGNNHLTSNQIDLFLKDRLIEVLDYKDQTRSQLPKLILVLIAALLFYAVAWLVLKTIGDFTG